MQCLYSDIEEIGERDIFNGKGGETYLITGASGFIASYIVHTLIYLNEHRFKVPCHIIALVRNRKTAEKEFKEYLDRNEFELCIQDIRESIIINRKIDYIIHTAGTTHKEMFEENPVTTIDTIALGTKNVLELAKSNEVKSMVYVSSAQIYGNTHDNIMEESQSGGFDPMNYKNCYAESKRFSETLCSSYFKQYGIPVRSIRLFHVYGPGISLELGTFFSEFISNVIDNKDIELKSQGKEIRNLCYITDAISAFFIVLYKGIPGEAYNVGSEEGSITIKKFAYLLCEICKERNIQVKEFIGKQKDVNNNILVQKPALEKIHQLGWQANVGIDEGICRLLRNL